MQQADALQAKRILQIQAILGSIAVVIALPFGVSVAVSVLIGAGACLLANWIFAVVVFRGYRAREVDLLLLRIYGAEVAKLVVLLGLFGVAFLTLDGLKVPALLAAYLVIQVASTLIAAQFGARGGRRQGTQDK
jgi:ATP synthase protein I